MTRRELLFIITICDEGTIIAASEKLNISQPSLSQSIGKIEKNLGIPLFLRNGRHIVPTAACRAIASRGRETLAEWDRLEDYILSVANNSKTEISIGMPSGICRVFYYPYLHKRMNALHPEIKINLIEERSDKVEQLIMQGELDLGILHSPLKNKNMGCIPLFDSTNILAVSKQNPFVSRHPYHGLKNLTTVDLSEIGDEPFFLMQHHKEDVILNAQFADSGFTPANIINKTSIWYNITDYMKHENCFSLIDENVVFHDANDSDIAFYRINSSSFRTTYLVFHPGKTLSEQERIILDCARAYKPGCTLV